MSLFCCWCSSGSSGLGPPGDGHPSNLDTADFPALPESPDVSWLRFARQKGTEPDARFECDTATDQLRAASREVIVADNVEPPDFIVTPASPVASGEGWSLHDTPMERKEEARISCCCPS